MVIGPSTIDFGEVAIRTVNTKPLVIVNHLDIHVFIQIEIDCRELRQSLPLTQVIPPRTLSKVDVVFESQKAGVFQRYSLDTQLQFIFFQLLYRTRNLKISLIDSQ